MCYAKDISRSTGAKQLEFGPDLKFVQKQTNHCLEICFRSALDPILKFGSANNRFPGLTTISKWYIIGVIN